MKKLLLIYIALLFIVGCKSKEKKFDDLEMMVYIISEFPPGETEPSDNLNVYCRYYILTDNLGKTKIAVQNWNKKNEISNYQINIDKNKINNLADSIMKLNSYSILRSQNHGLYCGPMIKMRLNNSNSTKTVCFINHYESVNAMYVNFYHYIDSLICNYKLYVTKDTANLLKRRNDFINWSFNMDTLIRPLPKMLKSKVKFVPPIIAPDDEESTKKD